MYLGIFVCVNELGREISDMLAVLALYQKLNIQ